MPKAGKQELLRKKKTIKFEESIDRCLKLILGEDTAEAIEHLLALIK
jgi:hypothetical protein